MSIQLKTKWVVLLVFALGLAIISFGMVLGYHYGQKGLKDVKNAYSDSLLTMKVKLHGAEMTAYQMTQLVVSQKQAIKDLGLKNSDLTKLNIKKTDEISQLKLKIDTLIQNVSHTGQVVVVHDTITRQPHNAILLPFSFDKSDKYVSLKGNFDEKGSLSVKLSLEIGIDAISGIDMQNKPKLTLLTDNPYIKAITVKSYKTNQVKPLKWSIGFQAGYGFVYPKSKNVELAPFMGVGVTRSLVRF